MTATTTSISLTQQIPLQRLHSIRSSKYSEYGETSTLASTTATLIPNPTFAQTFTPTTTLQIHSLGKIPFSLPIPPKELTTAIYTTTSSLSAQTYTSIRAKRLGGSCRLVLADDETETAIARTTYWFGPLRYPEIRIGKDDELDADVFEMVGRSLLSRAVGFESRKWGRFEWRYGDKKEKKAVREEGGGEVYNLMILEKVVPCRGEGKKEGRVRVAQMLRGEDTRAPGSVKMSAGNGGRLELYLNGEEGEVIDEVTVVVTCLVMLKKEIDRMRACQMAAISGAGA